MSSHDYDRLLEACESLLQYLELQLNPSGDSKPSTFSEASRLVAYRTTLRSLAEDLRSQTAPVVDQPNIDTSDTAVLAPYDLFEDTDDTLSTLPSKSATLESLNSGNAGEVLRPDPGPSANSVAQAPQRTTLHNEAPGPVATRRQSAKTHSLGLRDLRSGLQNWLERQQSADIGPDDTSEEVNPTELVASASGPPVVTAPAEVSQARHVVALGEPPDHEPRLDPPPPIAAVSGMAWTTARPGFMITWERLNVEALTTDLDGKVTFPVWSYAAKSGVDMYRCRLEDDTCYYYGSQAWVDYWCRAAWGRWVKHSNEEWAARDLLSSYVRHRDKPLILTDDIVLRLVQLDSLEHYIRLASRTEWLVGGRGPDKQWKHYWDTRAAEECHIPHAELTLITVFDPPRPYEFPGRPSAIRIQSTWRHSNGSLWAHTAEREWVDIYSHRDKLATHHGSEAHPKGGSIVNETASSSGAFSKAVPPAVQLTPLAPIEIGAGMPANIENRSATQGSTQERPPTVPVWSHQDIDTPEEAKAEQQRQDIRAFVISHGISTVYHFTPLVNLPSIAKHGILSRDDAARLNDPAILFPDDQRLDGATSYICCSIEWPNYKMMYIKEQEADLAFAVLALKASVLWECDCLFVPGNAARSDISRTIKILKADRFGRVDQLRALYPHDDNRNSLWQAYPTDVQAEVLIGSQITLSYLSNVYFKSTTDMYSCDKVLWPQHVHCQIKKEIFTFRPDHKYQY